MVVLGFLYGYTWVSELLYRLWREGRGVDRIVFFLGREFWVFLLILIGSCY